VTRSADEYVRAALRLIDDDTNRLALRRELIGRDAIQRLFEGRPEILGERLLALVQADVPA
jgi:hypothetical protein